MPRSVRHGIATRTDELKRYNSALEVAGRFGYDDVIDPADTSHPAEHTGDVAVTTASERAQENDRAIIDPCGPDAPYRCGVSAGSVAFIEERCAAVSYQAASFGAVSRQPGP